MRWRVRTNGTGHQAGRGARQALLGPSPGAESARRRASGHGHLHRDAGARCCSSRQPFPSRKQLAAGSAWRFMTSPSTSPRLRQFEPARGVRDPHHRVLASHVVESDNVSRPPSFDRYPAFQLHAEFGEESDGGVEVVDDDADIVHALNRHYPEDIVRGAPGRGSSTSPSRRRSLKRRRHLPTVCGGTVRRRRAGRPAGWRP
jgi:hypothetical protein